MTDETIIAKNGALTPIRFHFYKLKFTPYKNLSGHTSQTILFEVITYLTVEKQNGRGHLIDRHHNRKNEEPRELFMTSAVFMHKEKRIRCTLALLRSGRVPMLKPAEQFKLIPLDKHTGSIAEQTHFYIDYSKGYLVICIEFNNNGPRLPDIEYYLRNVAGEKLKLSKATETEMFVDTSIDKALNGLKNVLNMDIKVQPQKLAKMDTEIVGQYFTGINSIGLRLKPKYIKLETLFQTPGKGVKSAEINKDANNMFLTLLEKFKKKPLNIDCFDNFVVKYEDKDGQEEVFNLIKGKKEVIKEVDLNAVRSDRHWYELIEQDFNEFMESL